MTDRAITDAMQAALGHHQAGRLEAAEALYRQVLEGDPTHARALHSLGILHGQSGRVASAIDLLERAVRLEPGDATAHYNLGSLLRLAGRREEAIACLGHALRLDPGHAPTYTNLGLALHDAGRREEAVVLYERALALWGDDGVMLNNLGHALYELGRFGEAAAVLSRAVALRPGLAAAQGNLGNALQASGDLDGAIAAYRRALALGPDQAEAHANLSHVFQEQGRLDEALDCLRRALALKPELARVESNLASLLHFHPDYDAQAILAAHRTWARHHAAPLAGLLRPHDNDRDPDRRLRVGFVSPDLRGHPVGQMLLPLFAHHDPARTEFLVYSDVVVPDAVTRKLADRSEAWCNSERLSDSALAERIRGDRIDILVDLALHTARNRMLVFARKPAPVQVTMLGLPATTGLDTMDYRLTDPYLDPPGVTDGDYAERSVRLPHCFWCYEPREETPPVSGLPAREKGHVTFGCLNHFAKVSGGALRLWTAILQEVPGARLLLYSPHGSHRAAARALLGSGGIAPDRVAFVARGAPQEYLARYHDIDLALDPFPFCGGTTTMDALWMGVPVITLAGRTAVGRGGVSILSNAGLPGFIARTPEEYVAIAVDWARHPDRLAALRAQLRGRLRASPLTDGPQYAANVEAAFRQAWERWCRA